MMAKDDELYQAVKAARPDLYAEICAFASTFGGGYEDIDVSTRYQVERFCMSLVRPQ
jgi:hypothetical protein